MKPETEKKKIIFDQIKEVLVHVDLNIKIDKVLKSGCIDLDSIKEDDYRTAKNILIAVLEDTAEAFKPLTDQKKRRQEINNIKLFL